MSAVLALKRRHPEQVLAGLGMHPAWVTRAGEQEVAEGLRWLEANLAEADVLGEVGLDFKWAVTDEQQAWQQDILVRQFDLAERFRKPVNLHSRHAQRQTGVKRRRFPALPACKQAKAFGQRCLGI